MPKKEGQQTEQVEQRAAEVPTEHSAIVAFVTARADAKVLNRDINYLKKPFRLMASADPKVIEASQKRGECDKVIRDTRDGYFAKMASTMVKGTNTPVSIAVASLQKELTARKDALKAAIQQFEVFAVRAE